MEKSFFFIDGIQADKTSKRLMRRHVMKGKNAGKKFQRAPRPGLQGARPWPDAVGTPVHSRISDIRQELYCVNSEYLPSITADGNLGNANLTLSLPVMDIWSYSLKVIDECKDEQCIFHISTDLTQ